MNKQLDYAFMERINAKTNPERVLREREEAEQRAFDERHKWLYVALLIATFLMVFCLDTPC